MTYDRELRTEAAHALTHNQEVWSDRGYAVVTAGGLSEGDTDFELDVGPYDVLVGSTDTVSVGPTTLSVNAPTDNPYWLVVYVDGEGLQTEQGPEGEVFVGDQSVDPASADVREITSPAPPTLADIGPVSVLGKVLVTSSGVSDPLIDDRVFQSERVFETIDANAVTTERLESDWVVDVGNHASIQDGIEEAESTGKGLVIIPPGTYDETVEITDGSFDLYGFGRDSTQIDAEESEPLIKITSGANNVSVFNMRLRNRGGGDALEINTERNHFKNAQVREGDVRINDTVQNCSVIGCDLVGNDVVIDGDNNVVIGNNDVGTIENNGTGNEVNNNA